MYKGFMKFNDDQLNWLGNYNDGGGRIGNFDVQVGCPKGCIVCGADAEKYTRNMPRDEYDMISDSILNVKAKKGIDVLAKDEIFPSSGSDPAYYLSISKKNKNRAGIDYIAADLSKRHGKTVILSTSGWRAGDSKEKTYMQIAMENIVEDIIQGNDKREIGYSIKTVMPRVMKEYDVFLKDIKGQGLDAKTSNLKFIRSSQYVATVISNIHTLAPLNNETDSTYCIQYLNALDIISLHDEYARFSKLFSKEFAYQLQKHIEETWISNPALRPNRGPYIEPSFHTRAFIGLGRMLSIGIIDMSQNLENNIKKIYPDSVDHIHTDEYFAHIDGHGRIQLYYGQQHQLSRVLVPKEHFVRQAELSKIRRVKAENMMLAELQGKSLLN